LPPHHFGGPRSLRKVTTRFGGPNHGRPFDMVPTWLPLLPKPLVVTFPPGIRVR
jgi:hypothetical protein